ncbi:MAG TPA: DUF5668 domain-containing protein, partial [Bryobacteraceae bacterium]|nr:DUF5668 domain-containing protein [Bryobacteraceae bacterium]
MGDKQKTGMSLETRPGGWPLTPGMIIGLFLVLAGTLLFVDNLDILPFRASRMIWPGALVAYGLASAWRTTSIAV